MFDNQLFSGVLFIQINIYITSKQREIFIQEEKIVPGTKKIVSLFSGNSILRYD